MADTPRHHCRRPIVLPCSIVPCNPARHPGFINPRQLLGSILPSQSHYHFSIVTPSHLNSPISPVLPFFHLRLLLLYQVDRSPRPSDILRQASATMSSREELVNALANVDPCHFPSLLYDRVSSPANEIYSLRLSLPKIVQQESATQALNRDDLCKFAFALLLKTYIRTDSTSCGLLT